MSVCSSNKKRAKILNEKRIIAHYMIQLLKQK